MLQLSYMPNRLTPEIVEGIVESFHQVGGVDYLTEITRRDPSIFFRLPQKIVSSEINAQITQIEQIYIGKAMQVAQDRLTLIEG